MDLAMEPLFGFNKPRVAEFSWLTWLVASTCERLFKPTKFEFDANETNDKSWKTYRFDVEYF